MTNIFNKKDGLTDAVKSVMEINQLHREAEALVNEMFGVVSRKALPHEYQDLWEAEFNEILSEASCGKKMKMDEKKKELDPVGQEDGDVNNDGKINVSDKYLLNRRAAVTKSIMQREREAMSQMDEMDLSGVKPSANIEDRRTKGSRMDRPVSNQVTKSDQMKTPAMSKADRLEEKAVSKAQHRFFGLVRGIQKGEAKGSPEAEKAAKSMSVKSVRDYAKTKEKGLPEKIDEESLDSIQEEIATNLYAELNYVMEHHGEEAGDEWIANLSEEQLAIMEAMSLQDFMNRPASKNYMAQDPERSNRAVRGTAAIDRNAQAQRGMAQARAGSTDAARQRREADMAQKAREQGANKIRKTGPGFEQMRRNQHQDSTKTAPLAQTPRGYEGGGPAQKVDAKTMKATASSPVQQAAKQALNNKAKAPAPARKAKPAAPKPAFRANFQGGFGQRATQAKDVGRTRPGQDR